LHCGTDEVAAAAVQKTKEGFLAIGYPCAAVVLHYQLDPHVGIKGTITAKVIRTSLPAILMA
jgi:hypothetical protein